MKSLRRAFLILIVLLPVTVLVSSASWAETKLEATIFSHDGKDFVRTNTTLMDKGQSAADTKLDHNSAAYKALIEKRSYTGPATVFGRDYEANYAPLIGGDGKLTGALFVGVPK
jgi:methyl-accepting chemotaxis protein-2 (aspartate sensor receptor)